MPDFTVSPLSVVNQIKSILQDRYDSGFPRDILAFGVSGKATDHAAIGKFGLGQKAVFHLCDALVVYVFETVDGLAKTEELQTLLTILRHLRSIEIRRQDRGDSAPTTCCFVRMRERTERLRGPNENPMGRQRCCGRETTPGSNRTN